MFMLITFEPHGLETKFFFPLISELRAIRLHPMTSFFVIIIFPPFWIFRKTYFFKLLLGRCSNFHENWIRSSSDHADKKLWNSCWFVKPFSNTAQTNFMWRLRKQTQASISSTLYHIKTKLGTSHHKHDLRQHAAFRHSATYWSGDMKNGYFCL